MGRAALYMRVLAASFALLQQIKTKLFIYFVPEYIIQKLFISFNQKLLFLF